MEHPSEHGAALSRRGLVAGAAWAAPVIAVAAATPAAAASTTSTTPTVYMTGDTLTQTVFPVIDWVEGETEVTSLVPVTLPKTIAVTAGSEPIQNQFAVLQIGVGIVGNDPQDPFPHGGIGICSINGHDARDEITGYPQISEYTQYNGASFPFATTEISFNEFHMDAGETRLFTLTYGVVGQRYDDYESAVDFEFTPYFVTHDGDGVWGERAQFTIPAGALIL